jgi:hypothetical protein
MTVVHHGRQEMRRQAPAMRAGNFNEVALG